MNKKGGALAMAGVGVTQAMIKETWDSSEEKSIVCNNPECGAEYQYSPGKGIIPLGAGTIEGSSEEIEEEEEAPAPVVKAPLRLKVASPVAAPAKIAAPVRKFVLKKA